MPALSHRAAPSRIARFYAIQNLLGAGWYVPLLAPSSRVSGSIPLRDLPELLGRSQGEVNRSGGIESRRGIGRPRTMAGARRGMVAKAGRDDVALADAVRRHAGGTAASSVCGVEHVRTLAFDVSAAWLSRSSQLFRCTVVPRQRTAE